MKKTKPLLVIEVPDDWDDEKIDRLSDTIKDKVKGYQVITRTKDVEDYNLIF